VSSIQSKVSENIARYRRERDQFIQLIREQEALAARDPEGYGKKVVRFAWLGYLYVIGVGFLLLAILALLVYAVVFSSGARVLLIKVGIFLVPLVFYIAKSLFVKMEKPDGPRVSREEAPKLWAEVDQIAEACKAPKIDEIVLDMDMNAAAIQVPRFGMLGFYKNYLLLGLPLMIALPKDEMRSVIAHEFGHFSGQHGKMGGWIYRLNTTLMRIRESLAKHGGTFLFSKFFDWYQPRFDALSFALRRQNEYAADAAASAHAGADAAATALMRVSYLDQVMQKGVWDRITERSKVEPEAPRDAYLSLESQIEEAASKVDVATRLRRALATKTTYDDTHPSLTDRLLGLDRLPKDDQVALAELSKPVANSAAEEYLGSSLHIFLAQMSAEFNDHWKEGWKEIYQDHQNDRQELARLRDQMQREPLTWEQRSDLAFLTMRLGEPAPALDMFNAMAEERPADALTQFGLGEALLALDDPRGEMHLRDSFRLDMSYVPAATRLIAEFKSRNGNPDDLEELREEYYERMQEAQVIEVERTSLTVTDRFEPCKVSDQQREQIADQIRKRNDVKRAWLVTKVIPYEMDQRTNILLVEPTKTLLSGADRSQKVIDAVSSEVEFPFPVLVYAPPNIKPWERRLSEVPGSLLFEAAQSKSVG